MQSQPYDLESHVSRILQEGRPYPVLTVVHSALSSGVDLDTEAMSRISEAVDCELAQVERVAGFVRGLVGADSNNKVYRCVSVSCSMNGAGQLSEALGSVLDRAGALEVHCLDQCESGPSLQVDDSIYVGGLDDVLADERPWRDGPFLK